jgi:hypothetical protein
MITVVTYLWGKAYAPAHVQQLARSVAHHLKARHRFVCITDVQVPGVRTLRQPEPHWGRCYRRLWLFSQQARGLGQCLLHLDLDVVVCGPLDGLISAEPFRIYKAGSIAARGYSLNPSVMYLRTGTQVDIWDRFRRRPGELAKASKAAGFWGSDQAVISYLRLGNEPATYGPDDGVQSYRHIRHAHLTEPPPGTCIVSFHGKRLPWEGEILTKHPWIRRAWEEAA